MPPGVREGVNMDTGGGPDHALSTRLIHPRRDEPLSCGAERFGYVITLRKLKEANWLCSAARSKNAQLQLAFVTSVEQDLPSELVFKFGISEPQAESSPSA